MITKPLTRVTKSGRYIVLTGSGVVSDDMVTDWAGALTQYKQIVRQLSAHPPGWSDVVGIPTILSVTKYTPPPPRIVPQLKREPFINTATVERERTLHTTKRTSLEPTGEDVTPADLIPHTYCIGCKREIGFRNSYRVSVPLDRFGSTLTYGTKHNRTIPDRQVNVLQTFKTRSYQKHETGRACERCAFDKSLGMIILHDPDTMMRVDGDIRGKNVRVGSGSGRIKEKPDPIMELDTDPLRDVDGNPTSDTASYEEEVIGFVAGPVTTKIGWQRYGSQPTSFNETKEAEHRVARTHVGGRSQLLTTLKVKTGQIIPKQSVTAVSVLEEE